MELCGECQGPIQCAGDAKPVTLFPCGHLMHYHCTEYIRKASKLSGTKHCCPVCGCQIHDVVSLFVSEVVDDPTSADLGDDENPDMPLDVNAMLTRVFHYQKRNLMHQRQILESKIELRTVQTSLASIHQEKMRLEGKYGAYKHILQSTEKVKKVASGELLGLVVSTNDEVDQLKRNIDRLKALNQLKKRNTLEAEATLKKETSALAPTSRSAQAGSSNQHAPKRARSPAGASVFDVEGTDDDDDDDVMPLHKTKYVPDVQEVARSREREEDDLPPLFPVRPVASMPQMGVSFNRSVRDLPRATDALVQTKLRK